MAKIRNYPGECICNWAFAGCISLQIHSIVLFSRSNLRFYLKVRLKVRVHIKIIHSKFWVLNLKNSRVHLPVKFPKCLFIDIQKQYNTLKSSLFFQEKYKLYGWINWEFIGLGARNFPGIIFMCITSHFCEIYKSAVVYL